ncbi:MAG: M23 family metallopeptidase [Rickettsiales bacterium]|jgi:hypothetical protein|nr:M23 family metallopeptidase [Rickettsiales bacterium]
MDFAKISELLTNSGFRVLGEEGGAIVLEDPTCILRSLADFMNFAWIAIGGLAAFLLLGWAVSLIRGGKVEVAVDNLRNLFLLFAGLALVPAIAKFMLNEDLLQCKTMRVSISGVNEILSLKKMDAKTTVVDSGPITGIAGYINGHPMVDALSILSEEEQRDFRRVIAIYGLRIRGCEAEGCGKIGSSRSSGPPEHQGTDLYRAVGDPIPAFFNGVVTAVDPNRYGGVFTAVTIKNDNGTTNYFLYAKGNVVPGQRVKPGDIIAYSQDLTAYPDYAYVPNHVHVELWVDARENSGVVNFEGLF